MHSGGMCVEHGMHVSSHLVNVRDALQTNAFIHYWLNPDCQFSCDSFHCCIKVVGKRELCSEICLLQLSFSSFLNKESASLATSLASSSILAFTSASPSLRLRRGPKSHSSLSSRVRLIRSSAALIFHGISENHKDGSRVKKAYKGGSFHL